MSTDSPTDPDRPASAEPGDAVTPDTVTPDAANPDTDEAATPELPMVFRLNRVAYFAVPMVLIVAVILAGTSLPWFGWTLIVPILTAWWITRVRTVVTADGIDAVHTFATRHIPWSRLEGLQFPRWSSARAVTADGDRVRLPAIGFTDLPRLSAVSGGRIPDPFAAAAEAGVEY